METYIDSISRLGLDKILKAIAVLIVCLIVTKIILKIVNEVLEHSSVISKTVHTMVRTMVKILLNFLSLMVFAGMLGIPVTSFLALFSVVGLAVSLAIQGVLSNLAGGIIILVSKMFKIGDFIESDTTSGTVKEIGFLHTRLLSPDGKLIYVPNSLLHGSRVLNYSSSGKRRIDIKIAASYDNTPEEVRNALLQSISNVEAIYFDPQPEVFLEKYGDNSIDYVLRFWVSTPDYWPTIHRVNEQIYASFQQNGVAMSYPHMNVHLKV